MLDPRTHQPNNPFQLYGETRRNRGYHSRYCDDNTWEPNNSVLCPSKTEVKSKQEMEDDDSGMCSPPLWKTSPPTSPSRAGRTTSSNHYRSLSPESRTQAIVRGQRELMEMVRNMPESNYELSLKDLVEHHWVQQKQQQQQNKTVMVDENNLKAGGSGRKVMGQVKRSGITDRRSGGLYLKMAFPSLSLGSKDKNKSKKKSNEKDKDKKKNEQAVANGCSSTVSARPSVSDGLSKGGGGGVEKEWWKKIPSGSRESDSGDSSLNSGSTKSYGSSSSNSSSRSNSRHRDEKNGGNCWPFILRSKRQTQK